MGYLKRHRATSPVAPGPDARRCKKLAAGPNGFREHTSGTYVVESGSSFGFVDDIESDPAKYTSTPLDPNELDPSSEIICYGALYEGRVAHRGKKSSFQTFCKSAGALESHSVSRKDNRCFILQDPGQSPFAILDTSTTTALNSLQGLDGLTFAAVPRPLAGNQQNANPVVSVSINIYGPHRHCRQVGSRLTKLKHHLQHPDIIAPGLRYENPQYFRRPDVQSDMNHFVKPLHRARQTSQSVRSEVENILDTLDTTFSDDDIPFSNQLLTPLLKHQQIGAKFIQSRESSNELIGDPWYCFAPSVPNRSTAHIVSSQTALCQSYRSSGGIIADTMGMGKTLTMLSAILFSLDEAVDFMISTDRLFEDGSWLMPTKSTLVVVPSTPHWIRNPASKQFRAVNQLQGNRRWCLTGTPIQNKLEDLGALVTFLKTSPFNGKPQTRFKQHIIDPMFSDIEDPCQNLRYLLRSLCLRRSRQTSHSITVKTELIKLSLSLAEKAAYTEVIEKAKREMEMWVSNNLENRKYTKLFSAIHRLRILCVQGTVNTNPISWSSSSLSTQRALTPQVGMTCEICTAEESLDLIKGEDGFCPGCSRLLFDSQNSPESEDNSPYATPDEGCLEPHIQSKYPRRIEPEVELSTKMTALLKNLIDHVPTSKSIVFSSWTKSLDILCPKLEELGIPFVRIDGDVSRAHRTQRLGDFQNSPNIPVLLMTYGTGAVGLNLTAANRIHILEPQWNPSIEEQAIGRPVRLGQAREVTVVKNVVEHSVEENIISVQKNKQQLASLTLENSSNESLEGRMEELKRILFITR
ncbi:hypothetical protein BJX99DRAFT_263989 [Aspergillus californicus]